MRLFKISAVAAILSVVALAAPASAQPFVFDETQCYLSEQSWTGTATWASHGTVSVTLDNGKRSVTKEFTYSDGQGGDKAFQWSPLIYGLAPEGWMDMTITTQGRPLADIAYGYVGCKKQ